MKIFKTILVLTWSFAVCLLSAHSSLAADATFSWSPNNPDPSGYKIYYGIESRNYNTVVDVTFPAAVDGEIIKTVTELEEGQTYYFAATAYSETEESDYTDEVVYTVPVTPGLDPPVASDISLQGNEDSPITGQLLVETDTGADLEFSVASGPANGTLTIEDGNGIFSYIPSPDFSGVDTFNYTASNDAGSSAPATVTLTLSPINDLPVANNGSFTVSEDGRFHLYVERIGQWCLAARTRTRGQPISGELYGLLGTGESGCRNTVSGQVLDVGMIRLTPYR